MNNIVIAIDGPAASGKGTISKAISEKLQFNYLDTGKLYRAIGAKYLEGISFQIFSPNCSIKFSSIQIVKSQFF